MARVGSYNNNYLVTQNCSTKFTADHNFEVTYLSKDKLDKMEGYEFLYDKRLNVASFDNTLDLNQYLNYYLWVVRTIQASTEEFHTVSINRVFGLLDAGFVPFYMPPTFIDSKVMYDVFLNHAKKTGFRYHEETQYNFDGKNLETGRTDIWISKMDICDAQGISYDKFDIFKFWEGVL